VSGLLEECTRKEDERGELDRKLEMAVKQIIQTTTQELMGNDHELMEKKLKRAIA